MRPPSALLALLLLFGCGGSSSAAPETAPEGPGASPTPVAEPPPEPAAGGEQQAEPTHASPEVDGEIRRAALDPILEAGLGRFLQGVETQPVTEDGEFVGFRLEAPPWPEDPRFEDVALRPGDVIVRVNGQPIERPEQALRVWRSLRVASELMIEYLRDGERRELRYAIVD